MLKKIRQWLSVLLVIAVAAAFVISGVFFTLLLLVFWGMLELLMFLATRKPKGVIISKGQVITVDYKVLDETEITDHKK